MTRMLKTTIFAAGLLSAVAAQGAAAGGYGYEDGHYAHHSYASQYGYHNTYYESHYYSSHHAYHDPYTYHPGYRYPVQVHGYGPRRYYYYGD